jgi:tetratricopeptide (TPR) repeat protein
MSRPERPRSIPGHLLLVLVLSTAVPSPALAALWYEHYEEGEKALKEQNWKEAVRQFTQAIEKRAEPSVQARTYGMNFISYHPYLKLGIAYYNMGQLDLALQAFDSEEKFGAIAKSRGELKNLNTFRRLADESARATEQERIAKVVAGSLQEARALEEQQKLDEAMVALAKGLAVDPPNTEAVAMMERLRRQVATLLSERDREARASSLIGEGRTLLEQGNLAEASSILQQSLALRGSAEAMTLLEKVQDRLRQEAQTERGSTAPEAIVKSGLAEAQRLEAAGHVVESLQRLQTVLAIQPTNGDARALQDRLIRKQDETETQKARTEEVTRLMGEGALSLKNGAVREAVAIFNRAIALDPSNTSARHYLTQAFSAMSQTILASGGAPTVTKLIPDIFIFKPRVPPPPDSEASGGSWSQHVSSPDFVLAGLIHDDQPRVKVVFQRDPAQSGGGDSEESAPTFLEPETTIGGLYRFRFERSFHLKQGDHAFRVVATDPDDLTAEALHEVRYDRPLVRSPWLYSGLALFGAAAAGGLRWHRVRRRNRLLKRRFNPYVAGAPVLHDDLFIGREALLSRVLQTIHNNSILLYGERRIGKTSLQHHIMKRLQSVDDPDYVFYPVFIDLQGTTQERFFATLADDIFHELGPILGPGIARQRPGDGEAYDYTHFVRDIRQVMGGLKARSAKRAKLVLLIDEVDELNRYDPRINQKLRSLFMKSFAEDLVAVVSGVAIKKHWESEGSPWYNFFEEVEVKPFTRKDAEELIERPIRGIFRLEAGAIERIINNTDCKPYLIQKLCVELVNRMHDEKRRLIRVADVEALGRPAEG